MIFTDLPAGAAAFVDANTLVYHFSLHLQLGTARTALMDRIDARSFRASRPSPSSAKRPTG